ncbi:cyclin-dependent kinase G-2-like isoform X2 [Phalaenopsis equestris]|uniref:cyclin-dependent kinase G-2-like isoform X2 n=1 Tax=Phalaenopsis equestris TaxID=78828 RepID=UPI0009E239D8|nr:cyclin-dependent kinase G-2-like isoform X2 [Phalaenopsis equestris]XP_020571932.1 cyclin-dependent kinase G-2-like isoform X2 [Phalaenopsis equestris]XP_020571933.1 cyclin-dependent kinase G-2-like isoform X2 [Phalaenopsis equestris]
MAPGSFVGYGSYDSVCSEFGVDVLGNNYHYQGRYLEVDRRRSDGGDLQKDGMRRDYVTRENHRVMNGSNGNVQVLGCVSKRFMDPEPGELSSEDSSKIEDGVRGSVDRDEASSGKKRKLSHIKCDMDDPKSRLLKRNTRNKECSPVAVRSQFSLPNNIKNSLYSLSSLDQKPSIDFVRGLQLENGDSGEQMEEDYLPASTISLSRWADTKGSFDDDESAISDVDLLPNRRKNIRLASAQYARLETGEDAFREGSVSDGLGRETCLKPMEDEIDSLVVCGKDSNGEGSGGSSEGCRIRTLDSVKLRCRRINMFQGCRTVDDFEKLNKINEGTYGIVYRAKDKKTGEIVALKKVKMEKESEGFPLTSLREINILSSLHHPSIVEVKEVVVGRNLDAVFTVMEYMDHDLKGLIDTMKKPFHISEVKCLMVQLFAGVKHLHDNWVLHRDLKTSNLLFNNHGELKICDFGLSRQYGSPLKPYTQLVVTLWYRAPELLLGAKEYSTAIDMWSLGCIMAELLTKEPLFPGKSELDQLDKIFRILGTPDEKIWPGFSRLPGAKVKFVKKPFKLQEKFPRMSAASFLGRPCLSATGFNLLTKLLAYDPEKRITAEDALNHPWFHESPLPTTKDFMPRFPAQYRHDRHRQRIMKSPDPL